MILACSEPERDGPPERLLFPPACAAVNLLMTSNPVSSHTEELADLLRKHLVP
jgi:hypothetical protein